MGLFICLNRYISGLGAVESEMNESPANNFEQYRVS